MKNILAWFIAVTMCCMSSAAFAKCTKSNVERQLERGGWSYETLDNVDKDTMSFAISKDGERTLLFVDHDGDLSLRSWFAGGDSLPLSLLNKLNDDYLYVKAYLDGDDDLVLQMGVPVFDNECLNNISDTTRLYWMIRDGMEEKINEEMGWE